MGVCGCVGVWLCVGVWVLPTDCWGLLSSSVTCVGLGECASLGVCVCARASVNMPDRVYLCPSVCSEERPTQLTNPPEEMSRFSALIFSSKTTFIVY